MFVARKSSGNLKLDDFSYAEELDKLVGRMDELGSSTLLTGSLQLVGLGSIRNKLGSAWDSIAAQAALIAEDEITQRLGETDIFKPEGDGYLICFDHLDGATADQVAKDIAEAIEERLIEQLVGISSRDLTVTSFVARVPTVAFAHALDRTQALKQALEQIRIEVEAAAQERPIDRALRQANAHYQPIWSRLDLGKTHNRSLLDPLTGATVAQLFEELDDREDVAEGLRDLDCVLFTKSVEGLHRALKVMKRVSMLVPAHFNTLSGDLGDELVSLGKTVPASYQKFLALDVIGVPASAGQAELLRAAYVARQVADRVIFQVAPTDSRLNEPVLDLLWGLSCNLQELNTDDAAVQRELVRFAAVSAEVGLQSFAYGASTLGKAVAAVKANFDFVGGSAVHNMVQTPRPQTRFSPLFGEVSVRRDVQDEGTALRTHARFTPLNPASILTFPDGTRRQCRIVDVSASGAAISTSLRPVLGSILGIGSLPGRVVRILTGGFAVEFLEIQQVREVEAALVAPFRNLNALRVR